jgi:hypothetical protein
MQRAGVLRGAPDSAGELWPVPGAYEAADGWRLEVAHVECGQTGLPKQIGGGENKVSTESALAVSSLRAQGREQWSVRWKESQLQQTFVSIWCPGKGERRQQLSFATDDSMSAACLAWTGS